MPKHGGCWYCGTKNQETLHSIQKNVIAFDGKSSRQGVSICDACQQSDTLDLRVPIESRHANAK